MRVTASRSRFIACHFLAAVTMAVVPVHLAFAAPSNMHSKAISNAAGSNLWLIQNQNGLSVANASGPNGKPLDLEIVLPPEAANKYSFLMFRNMPPGFKLSAGFGTKTYWAVSLPDTGGLKIIPPKDFIGTFQLETLLVRTISDKPERVVSNIAFLPEQLRQPPLTAQTSTPAISLSEKLDALGSPFQPDQTRQPAPINRRQAALQPDNNIAPAATGAIASPSAPSPQLQARPMTVADKKLSERGDKLLQQGDVASARLIYRRLATKKIAESALALATTYDPDFLFALRVKGLRADPTEAKRWYKFAAQLGSREAEERLQKLATQGY